MLVGRDARCLELNDNRRALVAEDRDIGALTAIIGGHFGKHLTKGVIDVTLEDVCIVVPFYIRERHIGSNVIVILIFFAQQPDVMISRFGTVLTHRKEDAVDDLLILAPNAINNLLHRKSLIAGEIENFDDCRAAHDELRQVGHIKTFEHEVYFQESSWIFLPEFLGVWFSLDNLFLEAEDRGGLIDDDLLILAQHAFRD